MAKNIIIGIAGGSGSGKTSVAKALVKDLHLNGAVIIEQDWYYKDLAYLPQEERIKWNFDHPDSVEFDLLIKDLKAMSEGQTVKVPQYNYVTHSRAKETLTVAPQKVVIVEGIMVLYEPRLRDLLDIKIYVDTDTDIRFIRRLKRDIYERGRAIDNVINQYMRTVRPMHETFVEPSKRFADIIIPEGGKNTVAIDLLRTKIASLLKK
ncbi:MAG: uridine kinase [Candidatus Neomarinimicrobiota bacterium]|nr:uridine kinase [Candidatus Neomarinimicrobiota bacterium]MDD5710300.1 uridine kinase [Candidatus Neomarinimicrobiota bacterium]MDX9777514.1 uridine kinase [bacterium]